MRGSRFLRAVVAMSIIVLLAFAALPFVTSTPVTPSCLVKSVTRWSPYMMVVEIGDISKGDVRLADMGVILIPPVLGSPGLSDKAKWHALSDGAVFNYSKDISLNYVLNGSGSGYASSGDIIVIETNSPATIPDGEWQLYLTYEPTGGAIFGIIWTSALAPPGYDYLFANSSLTNPKEELGLKTTGSDYSYLVIFMVEAAILALMVFLMSRRER